MGRPKQAMQAVRIRLLWHPQAQFAGYHIAEQLGLGSAAGIAIRCEPIRFDQGGITALKAGDAEMAVASPSHVLESDIASGLRFILAIQQESSLVYPVRASSGITALSDLAGRRVGVWPGHEDLELRWMLKKAGVPEGAVTRVPMANTLDAFLAGQVDCAQMTIYHERHLVEAALGHDALRLFSAAPFGASLVKDGLVVKHEWLAANRDIAQAVVDAVLEGWSLAFTDTERALAICQRVRPDMTAAEHRAQLRDIRVLSCRGATLTHGLGYPDPEHVARALTAMRDLGMTAPGVRAGDVADPSLWTAAPSSWRSRTWARA